MQYRNTGIAHHLHATLKIEAVHRGCQLRELVNVALTEYCESHGLQVEPPPPDPRQLQIPGEGNQ